jgi:sporulation protein YlmC with PRC-barrel domain
VKADGALKLVGGVRDLQIVDRDDRKCGIADEIEFEGGPGKPLRIKAILVGPGAYSGRLPRWALALVQRISGRHKVRIPWSKVRSVDAVIRLSATASELGLDRFERKSERLLPHRGAY